MCLCTAQLPRLCVVGRPTDPPFFFFFPNFCACTFSQLTTQPSVVNGQLLFEDSPLVRAAKAGYVLVIDEAGTTPHPFAPPLLFPWPFLLSSHRLFLVLSGSFWFFMLVLFYLLFCLPARVHMWPAARQSTHPRHCVVERIGGRPRNDVGGRPTNS